jgi:hypothetical protein
LAWNAEQQTFVLDSGGEAATSANADLLNALTQKLDQWAEGWRSARRADLIDQAYEMMGIPSADRNMDNGEFQLTVLAPLMARLHGFTERQEKARSELRAPAPTSDLGQVNPLFQFLSKQYQDNASYWAAFFGRGIDQIGENRRAHFESLAQLGPEAIVGSHGTDQVFDDLRRSGKIPPEGMDAIFSVLEAPGRVGESMFLVGELASLFMPDPGDAVGFLGRAGARSESAVGRIAVGAESRVVGRVGEVLEGVAPVSAAKPQLTILNPHFTPTAPLHELLMEQASRRGFATGQSEALFWSGLGRGNAGVLRSQRYALENGGRTLEMTGGGKYLDDLNLFGPNSPISRAEAELVWAHASREFARGASGQIRAVTGSVRPNSIWRRIELPELMSNPRVWGIDELNLLPRIGFK